MNPLNNLPGVGATAKDSARAKDPRMRSAAEAATAQDPARRDARFFPDIILTGYGIYIGIAVNKVQARMFPYRIEKFLHRSRRQMYRFHFLSRYLMRHDDNRQYYR